MNHFDDHPVLSAAIETIQNVALGGVGWTEVLEDVARLTGSKSGQLIGFDGTGEVAFNWLSGVDPDCLVEHDAVGGNDGRINSRIPIGLAAVELEILDERHFTTESDRAANAAYDDCLERWDLPSVCLTNLIKGPDFGVGFSVVRSAREGVMSTVQMRDFSVLARHVRHAVRVQHVMQDQAALAVSGLLERMEAIGFICHRDGRTAAMSRSAERLLHEGDRLRLRDGAVVAAHGSAGAVATAVNQTLSGMISAPLILRDGAGQRPLVVEVSRLPFERHDAAFDEAVLVIVRDPSQADRGRIAAATAMFGYTTTEERVAAAMMAGQSPLAIAEQMAVEIATVRTHIRRLYEKSGVSSQLGLTSLLGAIR
ncbi:helix-turn-helix transcriptional regulator [Brevundimonas sp.]|uniref:helix-turn-helix transcriptional regulator n=1 Tax=Brevundimonas sp. TaxID=1871086 RepID=UPI00378407D4